jgi:DNA-binding LacI/PurR family transcriptional regulator
MMRLTAAAKEGPMASRPDRDVTIEDVARAAGVSRSTASRVMAGSGHASDAARASVRAAARLLGYAPNPVARALVRGAGYRMVVAVAGTGPEVLRDPYVDRVVSAAAQACLPYGIGVSLHWLPLAGADLDRLAADRSVRAVLLVNATDALLAAVPGTLRGRVVSIGIGSRGVPSFDIDNAGGAVAVLKHMYAAGRRRIAMVTGPRWMSCVQRPADAYRAVMREAGRPALLVSGDFSAASGAAAVSEILRRWPDTDAVFAISDATALGALGAFRQRGVDVPGDVAVAGFDDIPFAALSAPALTTASHPVASIAAAAASAVLAPGRGLPPVTTFPSELVVRESA